MVLDWFVLINGFAIGLAVAMPIGPLNVLCISRSLEGGFRSGLPVMLGTSLADASYALLAVLGLTVISDFLINYQFFLRLFGGFILLWLGIKAFRNAPNKKSEMKIHKIGFIKDILVIYSLTISSPLTILSFTALFASLGLGVFQGEGFTPFLLVLGVMLGTFSWMLLLTTISALVRKKAGDGLLILLNKIGAFILIVFAIALFASLAFGF